MKRNILSLLMLLLLSLTLVLPALATEGDIPFVTDAAGILTAQEAQELEQMAESVSQRYDFGVYIITVSDHRDYAQGDVFDVIHTLYEQWDLGLGEGKDGLVLFLSMAARDYCLYTYGEYGNYAFNDEGREAMTEFFLDDFANDNWYEGFEDYLSWSADYLEQAQAGTPYGDDSVPMSGGDRFFAIVFRIGIILLLPLLAAFIVLAVMKGKMKSVAVATRADTYMTGQMQLKDSRDLFTHSTESRVRIKSSSSGGSSSSHSGMGSGTSGKF